jgi:predicted nucleotidyltransferase
MNTPCNDETVARRILDGMQADEVWVFGSRARGDHQPESDLDLLVLVPESSEARHVRSRRARGIVADVPRPMDICVVTRREWNSQCRIANTLPFLAQREGRILAKRNG